MSARPFHIIVLIVALLLGACDRDTPNTATVPEPQQPTVNIGRLICGGHLSLAVVENRYQNMLRHFHLHTVQNHDWNDVVRDMKSGTLAGTFILSPLAMKLIRDGLPAKIVLMADRNGNGFVLSRKFNSIAQLKGANAVIAVPHRYSQHHVLLYLALKKHGVPYQDVSVIGMAPRDMINALKRGEIDGFVVGEPEGNRSLSLGIGWMAAKSPQIWPGHLDHVFLLSDRFVAEHPGWAQELITALRTAGDFIEAHPQKAAVMGEDYTGAPAAVFAQVLTDPSRWIDYRDMVPHAEKVRAMAEVMVEMGLWRDLPDDLDNYSDSRFIVRAGKR